MGQEAQGRGTRRAPRRPSRERRTGSSWQRTNLAVGQRRVTLARQRATPSGRIVGNGRVKPGQLAGREHHRRAAAERKIGRAKRTILVAMLVRSAATSDRSVAERRSPPRWASPLLKARERTGRRWTENTPERTRHRSTKRLIAVGWIGSQEPVRFVDDVCTPKAASARPRARSGMRRTRARRTGRLDRFRKVDVTGAGPEGWYTRTGPSGVGIDGPGNRLDCLVPG